MASSIKHNKHRNNFNSLKIPASFCLIAYHSSSWLLSSNHMDLLAVSPDSSFLRDISLLFPLPATVYFKYMRVSFLDSLQVSPQMSLCHHTLDHFMWNKADSFPQYPWSNLFGWPYIFIYLDWTCELMPVDLTSHLVFSSFYLKKCPNLDNKLFSTLPLSWFFFLHGTYQSCVILYICLFVCFFPKDWQRS